VKVGELEVAFFEAPRRIKVSVKQYTSTIVISVMLKERKLQDQEAIEVLTNPGIPSW